MTRQFWGHWEDGQNCIQQTDGRGFGDGCLAGCGGGGGVMKFQALRTYLKQVIRPGSLYVKCFTCLDPVKHLKNANCVLFSCLRQRHF